MKIIGTAKEEIEQQAAPIRAEYRDMPIIQPKDIMGIFPAAMVDHNPSTHNVNDEMVFNSYTPAKKIKDSELSNSVDQVLSHFFGDNELSKRNLLDKKPEPMKHLKNELTQVNYIALANERGIEVSRSNSRHLQKDFNNDRSFGG